MYIAIQIITITCGILLLLFTFRSVCKHTISELQSIAWFVLGLILILLGCFHNIIGWIAKIFNIGWPPAIVIYVSLITAFFLLFRHTEKINSQTVKQQELAMQTAILRTNKRYPVTESEGKILVLMPAYNEGESISKILQDIKKLPNADMLDILVIDDGSKDNTSKVAKHQNVRVLKQLYNMGYCAALQTGYKYACEFDYKYLIQMDADGQHTAENIERLMNKMKCFHEDNTDAPDIVIGSRFLAGSTTFEVSKLKKIVISMFCKTIKRYTGQTITDPTSGLWGMNRKSIAFFARYNNFHADYPDVNMVLKAISNGIHITEVPAVMKEREAGVSMHTGVKKALKYAVVMGLSTLSIILETRGYRKARKECAQS